MSQVLDSLVALLSLEDIEEDLYRGGSQDLGFRQLFGGQVLGQSLAAACRSVDPQRVVHSQHGYFLRPGDPELPVLYQVDRVRDGGSFSTRRVTAIQKGKPIFFCSASFQIPELGLSHQLPMPEVPGPEGLSSELEHLRHSVHRLPEAVQAKLLGERPIEIRPVTTHEPFDARPEQPIKQLWFRASGSLPADPALHKYLLAYTSDFGFLTTSLLPHGRSFWQGDMQIASLDHALWFHDDVDLGDWLLYVMDSPWAGNGRGYSRGNIFTRSGKLVASVAQEGLIRERPDWR